MDRRLRALGLSVAIAITALLAPLWASKGPQHVPLLIPPPLEPVDPPLVPVPLLIPPKLTPLPLVPPLPPIVPPTKVFSKPLDAYADFTADLLPRLGLGEKNTAVSPMSIYMALLMLAEGSAGDTRNELLAALRLQDLGEARAWFKDTVEKLRSARAPAEVEVANSVWVQAGYGVNRSYLNAISSYYGAEVDFVNFVDREGAVSKVNEWVRKRTRGLIDKLLGPGDVDHLTKLLLINALYFHAEWFEKFRVEEKGVFHAPRGDVKATFMRGLQRARVLEIDGHLAVCLEYKGTSVVFVVIVPRDLKGFLAEIGGEGLLKLLDALLRREVEEVNLYMPKFEIDSGVLDLKKALRGMGVTKAFDPQLADLSPMNERGIRELFVKSVLHRAKVIVDLNGTTAAAVTGIVIGITSYPTRAREVIINRPFLFLLVEPESRAVLFAGTYLSP